MDFYVFRTGLAIRMRFCNWATPTFLPAVEVAGPTVTLPASAALAAVRSKEVTRVVCETTSFICGDRGNLRKN